MELPIGNVYQQSARDERSTQWGPFNYRRSGGLNNVTVILGGPDTPLTVSPWAIPLGYIAHLRHLFIHSVPGAGLNIVSIESQVVDQAGNVLLDIHRQGALAADVQVELTLTPDVLLVDDTHLLQVKAVFNLPTAPNQLFMSAQVILLTRGNIANF